MHSLARPFTFVAALAVVFLTAVEAPGALRKWNSKMQKLGETLSDLVADVASTTPADNATKARITRNAKKMLALAHDIKIAAAGKTTKDGARAPEADPTLTFVSDRFERDIKHALVGLKSGHTEYAKGVLREASAHCIACHTRHDRGPSFPTTELPKGLKKLSPYERGEYFAAMRRFDDAVAEYEKAVSDAETARMKPLEWGKALRHSLALTIRTKDDPDAALAIVDKAFAMSDIPSFYREYLGAWKIAIVQWKAEQPSKPATEDAYFEEAKRLLALAKESQSYPLDHTADVLYWRASARVHQMLTVYPDGKHTSEGLLMAGNIYELIEDRLYAPLPAGFYELCVRRSPHTTIASQCFHRLEENILFGYTGSGGSFVPPELQALLTELRALAKPKGEKNPS